MTPSDHDLEQITGLTSDDLRRRGGVFTRGEIAKLLDREWQVKARSGQFDTDDDRRLWENYFEGSREDAPRRLPLQSWIGAGGVLLMLCAGIALICMFTQL